MIPDRIRRSPRLLAAARAFAGAVPGWSAARLARPCFVVGSGRSGTTMLATMLGMHPDIAVVPTEANHLWHPRSYPWHQHPEYAGAPYWVDPVGFSRQSAALHRQPGQVKPPVRAVFGAYQAACRRPVLINKSVMINFMLEEVGELFPEASFIVCRRDGRSVAYSFAVKELPKITSNPIYGERGFPNDFEFVLRKQAQRWNDTNDAITRYFSGPGSQRKVLEVRYEDLCSRPEPILQAIAGHLGVGNEGFRAASSMPQAGRNVKASSGLSADSLAAATDIMRPQLLALQYPV